MPDIKENLKNLIGETADKDMIEKVAVISTQVDEMIAQSEKQKADYKELLDDYAKVIKQSVYNVDNHTKVDEGKKDFNFDSFVEDWQAKNKK